MTYLQLVQRLRQECSISGTGPTTTVSQTGELRRLVDWVAQAWVDIQNMNPNWTFMRSDFSFSTTTGVGEYSPSDASITNLSRWHTDTLRIYNTAIGVADEQYITDWDYQSFRNTYRYGTQVDGVPCVFAVRPADRALMFGPKPNDVFTITGEYQKTPTALSADTDVPAIDADLQMIIVWRAMMYYGMEQAAPEVIALATSGYNALMNSLIMRYLPTVE